MNMVVHIPVAALVAESCSGPLTAGGSCESVALAGLSPVSAPVIAQWISFQQPGFAVAAAALITVPWLIHILNRRRYRREPWAAMQFLVAADTRHRRRLRIEKWILLFLRTLLIAAIPLAAARPYVTSSVLADTSGVRRHRILLLDDSLSMQARHDESNTCFDLAVDQARRLVNTFDPDEPVTLITLTEPDQPALIRCQNRRSIIDALSMLSATNQRDDPVAAINAARELLDDTVGAALPAGAYLISDLPRSTWSNRYNGGAWPVIDAAKRLGARATLTLIHCTPADTANVALTQLEPVRTTFERGAPLRLMARIDNFSLQPVSGIELEITSDGRILRRLSVPAIKPGTRIELPVSVVPTQAGDVTLEAHIRQPRPDALPVDDSRFAVTGWGRAVNVLIVENFDGADNAVGSGAYLAAALAPVRAIDPPTWINADRISPDQISTQVLDDYRLVALCDVSRLEPAAWHRLTAYVRHGGALLVSAGEAMDRTHYNSYAADSQPLLPAHFGAITEPAKGDAPWRIARTAPAKRLINAFAAADDTSLFRATLQRLIHLQPLDPLHDVLLATTDNRPLLIAGRHGAGRVAVWASTLDMRWNNLPARGDFVALAQQLVAELVPLNAYPRNSLAGERYRRPLRAEELMQSVRWLQPDGTEAMPMFDRIHETRVVTIENGEAIGVHRVGAIGHEVPFAVNVHPAECDLTSTDTTKLKATFPPEVSYVKALQESGDSLPASSVASVARYLLVAAVVLVALEVCVASGRRARWQVG